MKAIYKFFRSVKLAVTLLVILIVLAILSTLVQQGKGDDFYRQSYGSGMGNFVVASGIANFSHSFIFLVPMGLFIINLGCCTVDRLVSRARRGAKRHYGPDLIHISLLILTIGALVTSSLRKEQYFTMGPGDAVALPGGYKMSLLSFDFLQYSDGRPKAWISTVDVSLGDKLQKGGFAIQVNHPLKIGFLKVYQSNYGTEDVLHLAGADGRVSLMTNGQAIKLGDTEFYFAEAKRDGVGDLVAVMQEWKGQDLAASHELKTGGSFGPYRIAGLDERQVTGLTAVHDPGFVPVLAALVLGTFGLALTTLQKKGKQL